MLLTEQIIQENIQYITEMLSISDDVLAITDELYKIIFDDIHTYKREEIYTGGEKLSGREKYELMGYTFDVKVTVYSYEDSRLPYFYRPPLENSFDGETQILTLSFIMVFGQIYGEYTDAAITHEVLHMYQWCKNKVNNPRFEKLTDDTYKYSCENLYSDNEYQRKLGYLMYYANPREQDAFVHEYYQEAKRLHDNNQDWPTSVEKRLDYFTEYLDWYKREMRNPRLQRFLERYRELGYTPENILKYAEKGLRRFNLKIGKVKARLLGEFNTRAPFGENILKDLEDFYRNLIEENKNNIQKKKN